MRRSAAPSSLGNPAKRPKFSVPFKNPVQATNLKNVEASEQDENRIYDSNFGECNIPKQTEREISDTDISTLETISNSPLHAQAPQSRTLAPEPTFNAPLSVPTPVEVGTTRSVFRAPLNEQSSNQERKTMSKTTFKLPQRSQTPQQAETADVTDSSKQIGSSDCITRKYFNVVWCKLSKKKHKKWEGDAVLITCGRSVTLYDMEGKEIGKGTGYKSTELQTLKEDETLVVGGKEIQVMSELNEEMFKSGKCFSAAGTSTSVPSTPDTLREPQMSKPFVNPHKDKNAQVKMMNTAKISSTPRYDPDSPDALVMPRPSQAHQWTNNKKSLPVVDVVVDPYLSVHLRPHQREGIKFLYECIMGYRDMAGQGAILADDMGLGKTLQCISVLWTLYKQGPYGGKPVIKQALIITPGSLVKNWHQEFKKWLGTERLSVYAVSSDKRVEEFSVSTIYPVLIISYEMFVRAYELVQKLNFDLIICDEGHRLKNTAIKTTSLIMSLPTRRRIVLTGTPIQNDLQEFYSIVEFCNPGILGTSAAFKRVYDGPIVASRQPNATPDEVELGEERGTELARLTKLFVLRRTSEINNKYLPPKCEIVLFCRASQLQLVLYHKLLCCSMIRSCILGQFDGSPHLICIGALKQLCNHPKLIYNKVKDTEKSQDVNNNSIYKGLLPYFPLDFTTDDCVIEHSGKLIVLAALLDELHTTKPNEKIVLVSNQTKTLDILQKFCDCKNYKYLRLDGQTPTNRRQELVNRFNSKHVDDFVFLLSSKAGGVGLNLVGASRLVLFDIDWNPANDLQAMARVWRDGQRKQVYIYRLLTTGTIEEKIYQRQISKQGLSGAVIDARDNNEVQFSQDDLKDLFSLNERTDCDTHELLNCTCDLLSGHHDNPCQSSEAKSVRECQLGAAKNVKEKKKSNLSMDELMSWKHISGEAACKYSDWFLSQAEDVISYAFWHKTNSNR